RHQCRRADHGTAGWRPTSVVAAKGERGRGGGDRRRDGSAWRLVAVPFLDTNIFLRHLRQDNAFLSPKATAIFTRIEQGQLQVRTADTVIFETVFTLQRSYQQPRERIAEGVLSLLELPGISLP